MRLNAKVGGLLLAMWSTFRSTLAVLDAGGEHACATAGSDLMCWGSNAFGQLGRGDTDDFGDDPGEDGDNFIPVDLGEGETLSEIALGQDFTCVLLESGDMKCFGKNDKGQLGQGNTTNYGGLPNEMGDDLDPIDLGTGVSATAIATGCEHTCALVDDGSVKCFGYNNYGQLGQGNTDNIGDDPNEMGDNLEAVTLGTNTAEVITAGCDHTCALLDSQELVCWGRNTFGQLGTEEDDDLLDEPGEDLIPVDLGGEYPTSMCAGESHTCVVTNSSAVKCWGRNNDGQLGQGNNIDIGDTPSTITSIEPVDLGTDSEPTAVACGSYFTCVFFDDGEIKCFGRNIDGQLGIGTTDDVGTLATDMGVNLTSVDLGDLAADVATGFSSACARLDDDNVKCWGDGSAGQLATGNDLNVGDEPDELAELDPIDFGEGTTAAPTATPVEGSATFVPSASPSDGSRVVFSTASPTSGLTANGTTMPTPAPVEGQTPSPAVTDDDDRSVVITSAPDDAETDTGAEDDESSSVRLKAGLWVSTMTLTAGTVAAFWFF